MWRVKRPDGGVTDMVNRARARDAARSVVLAVLNSPETPIEAPPIQFQGEDAPEPALSE
jgi:hypothetical protein